MSKILSSSSSWMNRIVRSSSSSCHWSSETKMASNHHHYHRCFSLLSSSMNNNNNKTTTTASYCCSNTSNSRIIYQHQANNTHHILQSRRRLHLTPRELDHLTLHQVGRLAQYRLARGLRLNHPEAVGLLTMQMMEDIRSGNYTVASLMQKGQTLLGLRQVQPGVASLIPNVQIEGTFPDGTKLLTIHHPIALESVDSVDVALEGSFLPVPDKSVWYTGDNNDTTTTTIPGAIITSSSDDDDNNDIVLNNDGRSFIEMPITNTGDRPIQVGSHYPLVETNKALRFDRRQSIGYRLNIPSGSSVRLEPGDTKTVTLVELGGTKRVNMGNRLCQNLSTTTGDGVEEIMNRVREGGFLHEPLPTVTPGRAYTLPRAAYADMYGPTVGDKVVLGDTSLVIEVERDLLTSNNNNNYGEECKFGGGKTLREGMGQSTSAPPSQALDVVVTNALIVDAVSGIIKADIGIKDNRIVGLGKAGNPDIQNGVTPGMVVGNCTDVIAAEGRIVTAGGMDSHVHWICPQQIPEALGSGVTTMLGGGTGPSAGTCATTCTPSPSQMNAMLRAVDGYPLNFGFSGKGNTSDPSVLTDVLLAGAAGFKLHEDWGTTPSAIDAALTFADQHDVAVTIHTDTLNESGFVDDSIAAIAGRTIHTYHTEGAGGGHAPDILKIVSEKNVLPSSTNPTRPFTINTMEEHLDMLMVCHHLSSSIPEDIAFAESRIRAETIAAEDLLHDMGAISIMSSDSQAMGRVGEVITRTWQTADKMKQQFGALSDSDDYANGNDNTRVKRYIAKYTINPCLTHGMAQHVGSVEKGKLADLVLWKPALFGAKPEMIVKGGMIAMAQMGDPNASIPTPQPVQMREMFVDQSGGDHRSMAFVSAAAVNEGKLQEQLGKTVTAVEGCRTVTKDDLPYNTATPEMEIDPETFQVKAD
eukprot:CAMPEP_0194242528 /NCGR_PEP_ID=MMETSP0158-20130606/8034_1 /TAXON_ID=33649 /ORGANISM="Thalassionema nitzschioides, Strain L26-B" /LENGTH=922 /DNA_ID=CAMNT_0038977635 /DNA_START=1 /DNA_END=2766 /DNA_ORIENTATION=+